MKELTEALTAFVRWAEQKGYPVALIGGYAASLLGNPRATEDIDFIVSVPECDWEKFAREAEEGGFSARDHDLLEFARKSRVFLLRHNESGTMIDCIIAGLPYEEQVIDEAQFHSIDGGHVPVARASDLILLKSMAMRPRDVADIEHIVRSGCEIDWEYVLGIARDFGAALDRSDFVELLEKFQRMPETE